MKTLQKALEGMSYTCGSMLEDLQLSGKLANVHIRDLKYYDPNHSTIHLDVTTKSATIVVLQTT